MINKSSSYKFVDWDSRDDPLRDIVPILGEYYGPTSTSAWCRYRFASPYDHTIACLVYMQGTVIGIAAARIQEFTSSGTTIVGTVSIATYVSPEHRGKGLYPKLLDRLEIIATELGAAFQVALPNELSASSFSKAGYLRVGDSRERITPTSLMFLTKGIMTRGQGTAFSPDPASPEPLLKSTTLFASANNGLPYVYSKLSSEFLIHRLSPERERSYTTDFFDENGVILMHGRRGRLRECKILATSKRSLRPPEARALRRDIIRKYGPDLITERFTSHEPPVLTVNSYSATRRANPPLFVNTTPKAPPNFDPRAIRLTGIDTHTW